MTDQVRYNIKLPEGVYSSVTEISERYGTTRLEIIRKFILLGLYVVSAQDEGKKLYTGDDDGQLVEIRLIV